MVTHDADFLRYSAHGIQHAGIAYWQMGARTIGQMIETLRLMHEVMTSEEMQQPRRVSLMFDVPYRRLWV